jgi:hypothetical protein
MKRGRRLSAFAASKDRQAPLDPGARQGLLGRWVNGVLPDRRVQRNLQERRAWLAHLGRLEKEALQARRGLPDLQARPGRLLLNPVRKDHWVLLDLLDQQARRASRAIRDRKGRKANLARSVRLDFRGHPARRGVRALQAQSDLLVRREMQAERDLLARPDPQVLLDNRPTMCIGRALRCPMWRRRIRREWYMPSW